MFRDWGNCVKDGVATISCVPIVLLNVINAMIAFAGAYALYLFIMGGYKFISSNGDQKRLDSARANLMYGILGMVMIFSAFFIINIVAEATGVKCILKIGFMCK